MTVMTTTTPCTSGSTRSPRHHTPPRWPNSAQALNDTNTIYPGTGLTLSYSTKPHR